MVMKDVERMKTLSRYVSRQVEYLVKKEAYLINKSMRGELPFSMDPKPPLQREIEALMEKVHKDIMAEIEKL